MLALPTIFGIRGGAKGALSLSCCLVLAAAMLGQTGGARADDADSASVRAAPDSGAAYVSGWSVSDPDSYPIADGPIADGGDPPGADEGAATEIAENQVPEVQSGAPAGGEGESFAGPAVAAASPAELPRPLSDDDARRYERIFALQRDGEWRAADAEIKRLKDRLLMGHVLAQRYLHPKLYRASFTEMRDWLALYSDHPRSTQMYQLALKRKPKKAAAPKRPEPGYLGGSMYEVESESADPSAPSRTLSANERSRSAAIKSRLKSLVRSGSPDRARKLIETAEARKLFDEVEMGLAQAEVATSYYVMGRDEDAHEAARSAAQDAEVPQADWIAGLAAWRLGDVDAAAEHFEAAATAESAGPWDAAAAAYWAARANLVAHRPERVTRFLQIAADHDHTFYGILARRALAMPSEYNWGAPALDRAALTQVTQSPRGRRALALIQVGQRERAEEELRKAYGAADQETADTILALALAGDLPGLAMRIGVERQRETGEVLDAALYPVPSWAPKGGFRIDRALLLAVMRQESHFNTEAESAAGARGLMQIMPDTALFLNDGEPLKGRGGQDPLFDPARNIALGQDYIARLLEDEAVQGNLFLLAAAYNGGPGKLARWQRRVDYGDDPLLFIESIPARETRTFVERVFTNMWIYQQRLGQPSPSLDSVVAGQWPIYAALDKTPFRYAERGGD